MNFETWFHSLYPTIPVASAAAVLHLAAEGGTIPFIARYRKEQTGNLDDDPPPPPPDPVGHPWVGRGAGRRFFVLRERGGRVAARFPS